VIYPAIQNTFPPLESAPNAKITESSVYQAYGAAGLLRAVPPGWHVLVSALPQSVEIDFEQEQTLTKISLLSQDGFAIRAPKNVALEVMNATGRMEVLTVEDACTGTENRWRTFPLNEPLKATRVTIVINSNCGDPGLVTLRGLTF
jgi:hypothetical protein